MGAIFKRVVPRRLMEDCGPDDVGAERACGCWGHDEMFHYGPDCAEHWARVGRWPFLSWKYVGPFWRLTKTNYEVQFSLHGQGVYPGRTAMYSGDGVTVMWQIQYDAPAGDTGVMRSAHCVHYSNADIVEYVDEDGAVVSRVVVSQAR